MDVHPDYSKVNIHIDDDQIVVLLADNTTWDGSWPEIDPPRGYYLFTVESAERWMTTDFGSDTWCRPMAEILANQRCILQSVLPKLKTLIAKASEIELNVELRTLFKLLQFFARVSLAFARSRGNPRSTAADDKQFILEGLRVVPKCTSTIVDRQIENLSKQSSNLSRSRKPTFQPTYQRGRGRGFSRGRGRGRFRPDNISNVRCHKCGKLGHLKRNCRIRPVENKK